MRVILNENKFKMLVENGVSEYWEKKGIGLKKYFTDDESKSRQCAETYPQEFIKWCIRNYGKEFECLNYVNFDELYDRAIEMGAKANDFYEYTNNSFNGNNSDWRIGDTGFFNAPAHLTMEYNTTFTNKWVIHFTNNAESIARNGFSKGVNDYESLPWTHDLTYDKKNGDYAFGYLANTVVFMGMNESYYGDDCVICMASGIEAYHKYDDEYDAIFNGKAVRYICPIYSEPDEGYWYIKSIINDRILYSGNKLSDVIKWFTKNYLQYKRHLFYTEK